MDLKPAIIFICTLFLTNIDNVLKTSLLVLNVCYISYQFYKFYQNNKKE